MRTALLLALIVLPFVLAAAGGISLARAWLRSRPCEKCVAVGSMCDDCMDDEISRMGW